MANTSLYIPPVLLARLDEMAQRHGVSRNKVILRAVEEFLNSDLGDWPKALFIPYEESEGVLMDDSVNRIATALHETLQGSR